MTRGGDAFDAFDALVGDAGESVVLLDPFEDRFVAANPAACRLLGFEPDELLETPVSRIHAGELPLLQKLVGRVLRTGHGSTITLCCRTRGGDHLPTEMSVSVFEPAGRVYLLALIQDRSDHRRESIG